MDGFRALPRYFVRQAQELCDTLLLDLRPTVDLNATYDSLVDCRPGQSFVSNPSNQLRDQYLQLADQAAGRRALGLVQDGTWQPDAVHRYLLLHDQLLEYIAGTFMTASGQGPRVKELEGIEYTNSPSTERAIYVYEGKLMYLTRHSKSKRATGGEFIVARFLPTCAGHILCLYLVYIRPFAEPLCREQGFSKPSTRASCFSPWCSNSAGQRADSES